MYIHTRYKHVTRYTLHVIYKPVITCFKFNRIIRFITCLILVCFVSREIKNITLLFLGGASEPPMPDLQSLANSSAVSFFPNRPVEATVVDYAERC